MSDLGHDMTDEELSDLEKRIANEYKKAADDLADTIDAYFEALEERDKKMLALLEKGKITEQEYTQWRLAQIGRGKRFEALRDQMAERYTKANEVTAAYINDTTPGIYSLNYNFSAYTIEKQAGDVGFNLLDEQTVKRLIVDRPDSMPYYPPERAVQRGIDLAFGKRQITAQVTQGILQGLSVPHISDRLQKNIPNMERVSAVRAARTAVTGAQNAGRMASYKAAKEMGITLKKEWLATLDNRTRHEHRILDGQKAEEDEPFKVNGEGIMFPGDPNAAPHLVYNCRCTLIAAVDGVEDRNVKRRAIDPETGESVLIKDMTYTEWENLKKQQSAPQNVADFSGVKGIDKAFANGMKDALAKSPHKEVQNIYAKYQNELACVDDKCTKGAFFRSFDRGIHFNAAQDMVGNSMDKPFEVAFHEFGHNIDWLIGKKNPVDYASNLVYNGSRLGDVIKGDYLAFRKSLGIKNHRDLIQHLKDEKLPLSARGNISDVLEGCTNISYPLGAGHGAKYHKTPGKSEREFFAEVLDSAAVNPESFAQMQRIFPNAVKMVFDIIGGTT